MDSSKWLLRWCILVKWPELLLDEGTLPNGIVVQIIEPMDEISTDPTVAMGSRLGICGYI